MRLQGREVLTYGGQRVSIDVSGHVDADSLPEKLRDRAKGEVARGPRKPPGRTK